jgi:uncharacterized protein
MANFIDKINGDIKQAMRDKKSEELSALRMLLAALKNQKIELGNKDELTDDQAIAVIKKEVKKRKDSLASYLSGNRQDLADKEQAEITLLNRYLPEEMSDEEIEKIIAEVIAKTPDPSPAKFGQIMGGAIKALAGKADGQKISEIVKKLLTK